MEEPIAYVRPVRVLANWLIGFVLATLAIWGIGAAVLSDVMIWQFDDVTARWLPAPDRPYTYTREGWGTTTWQTHARLAEQLPAANEPTVVFWGDSYVEALQLNDREKMFNVFTRLEVGHGSNLRGVGVALSGWNLTDYYDLLPKLQGRLGKPARHVFVIQADDMIDSDVLMSRIASPTLPPPPRFQHLRQGFYRLGLEAFWALPRDAAETVRNLRFRPGQAKLPASPPPEMPSLLPELFADVIQRQTRGIFDGLQQRADAPILFVLIPRCPQIRTAHISFDMPADELRSYLIVAMACSVNNVDCLDMARPFNDFYRRTGKFPRGFANTIPGEGHLNADGHRLVAEAVADWLAKEGAGE